MGRCSARSKSGSPVEWSSRSSPPKGDALLTEQGPTALVADGIDCPLGDQELRQNGIMDAGLAALLGAAVGSLATVGSALVSGRATARSQFDQWRRQHRRDAYANYLGALHDRDIAMDAVLDALRPETPDLRDTDEKVRRFVALAREAHRAAEVVILEGPLSTVEAADRVARRIRKELSTVITVSALHVGYMDTDMAAGVPADQKVAATDVAAQALDGIETGLPEILADETSRYVKQSLSAAAQPAAG
ncbi:hypothetical protein STENM223S_03098 [Streptomyces tendae]